MGDVVNMRSQVQSPASHNLPPQKNTTFPHYPSQNGYHLKKKKATNAGEDVGNKEHLYTVGGNVN
jgi:hypothetical protein